MCSVRSQLMTHLSILHTSAFTQAPILRAGMHAACAFQLSDCLLALTARLGSRGLGLGSSNPIKPAFSPCFLQVNVSSIGLALMTTQYPHFPRFAGW